MSYNISGSSSLNNFKQTEYEWNALYNLLPLASTSEQEMTKLMAKIDELAQAHWHSYSTSQDKAKYVKIKTEIISSFREFKISMKESHIHSFEHLNSAISQRISAPMIMTVLGISVYAYERDLFFALETKISESEKLSQTEHERVESSLLNKPFIDLLRNQVVLSEEFIKSIEENVFWDILNDLDKKMSNTYSLVVRSTCGKQICYDHELLNIYRNMKTYGKFSKDNFWSLFTIKFAEGIELKVTKAFLFRIPYFDRMLKSDMVESRENFVDLSEMAIGKAEIYSVGLSTLFDVLNLKDFGSLTHNYTREIWNNKLMHSFIQSYGSGDQTIKPLLSQACGICLRELLFEKFAIPKNNSFYKTIIKCIFLPSESSRDIFKETFCSTQTPPSPFILQYSSWQLNDAQTECNTPSQIAKKLYSFQTFQRYLYSKLIDADLTDMSLQEIKDRTQSFLKEHNPFPSKEANWNFYIDRKRRLVAALMEILQTIKQESDDSDLLERRQNLRDTIMQLIDAPLWKTLNKSQIPVHTYEENLFKIDATNAFYGINVISYPPMLIEDHANLKSLFSKSATPRIIYDSEKHIFTISETFIKSLETDLFLEMIDEIYEEEPLCHITVDIPGSQVYKYDRSQKEKLAKLKIEYSLMDEANTLFNICI